MQGPDTLIGPKAVLRTADGPNSVCVGPSDFLFGPKAGLWPADGPINGPAALGRLAF